MTALTDKLAKLQDQTDLARLVIAGKANEPVVELLPQLQATLDQARAATRSEFAASDGAAKVGFIQSGTGAVLRTMQDKARETVSVKDFGGKCDGITDDTAAFKSAVSYLAGIGGGELHWSGPCLLNGEVGEDGVSHGVLLPDTGGNFSAANGIRLVGDGVSSALLAGANGMMLIRASRLYSGGENFLIDGNGKTGVWGVGMVPQSTTQTTRLVSHSYQRWDITVKNTAEGIVMQPGPSVAGSDSGCFYHAIRLVTDSVTRAIWLKQDATATGNRVTRSSIELTAVRGNTGLQLDYGSEIDILAWCEMLNTGATPNATPVAILVSSNNTANIVVKGYAEACTRGLVALDPTAISDNSRFMESGVQDSSNAFITGLRLGRMLIGKRNKEPAHAVFSNPSFVRFTADKNGANTKELSLLINDVEIEHWASTGYKEFRGSVGSIKNAASGAEIEFTRNGANYLTAVGGASAALYQKSSYHGWQNATGEELMSLGGAEFIPRKSGISFGIPGYIWESLAAKNVALFPPASATPANNGELLFELTSNTTLKVKVKGADGVVRSATLTLA